MAIKIPLMKSTFYREEYTKRAICDFIMSSPKLSMGEQVSKFEKDFSTWQQCSYATMVNSGSSANLVLIQSLLNLRIIKPGCKIGVSSVTWATNVMPVIQLGCIPVLIDVNLENLNVCYENVITKDIDVLFITHLLGFHGDIENISKYCADNNIILIEDTCESLGTTVNGKKLGNFGLASTFSTFVGHHMSTIEGGVICTNDTQLSNMVRMVRSHGWDRNVDDNHRSKLRTLWNVDEFYGAYTFYTLGYNLRPTDIQGVIGLIQLEFIDEANEHRRRIFSKVKDAIVQNKDIITPNMDVPAFAIPVICKNMQVKQLYMDKCKEAGIEIRPIVAGNMKRQPFFKEYDNNDELINAEVIHNLGFYLPNHPELTDADIDLMCHIFI